jgi:hypothetical protein
MILALKYLQTQINDVSKIYELSRLVKLLSQSTKTYICADEMSKIIGWLTQIDWSHLEVLIPSNPEELFFYLTNGSVVAPWFKEILFNELKVVRISVNQRNHVIVLHGQHAQEEFDVELKKKTELLPLSQVLRDIGIAPLSQILSYIGNCPVITGKTEYLISGNSLTNDIPEIPHIVGAGTTGGCALVGDKVLLVTAGNCFTNDRKTILSTEHLYCERSAETDGAVVIIDEVEEF